MSQRGDIHTKPSVHRSLIEDLTIIAGFACIRRNRIDDVSLHDEV